MLVDVDLLPTVQALGRTSTTNLDGIELLSMQDVRGSKQIVQLHASFHIVKSKRVHQALNDGGLGLGSVVVFDADHDEVLFVCWSVTVVYTKNRGSQATPTFLENKPGSKGAAEVTPRSECLDSLGGDAIGRSVNFQVLLVDLKQGIVPDIQTNNTRTAFIELPTFNHVPVDDAECIGVTKEIGEHIARIYTLQRRILGEKFLEQLTRKVVVFHFKHRVY
jgi:hypothetical protein